MKQSWLFSPCSATLLRAVCSQDINRAIEISDAMELGTVQVRGVGDCWTIMCFAVSQRVRGGKKGDV